MMIPVLISPSKLRKVKSYLDEGVSLSWLSSASEHNNSRAQPTLVKH